MDNDRWVALCDPKASRWCAIGAVRRITGRFGNDKEPVGYLARAIDGTVDDVIVVNDKGTALDVGKMYCRAIQLAEADGR